MAGPIPTEPVIVTLCPALRSYTKAQLSQLDVEIGKQIAANPNSMLVRMLLDYRALRDACRAINNRSK